LLFAAERGRYRLQLSRQVCLRHYVAWAHHHRATQALQGESSLRDRLRSPTLSFRLDIHFRTALPLYTL